MEPASLSLLFPFCVPLLMIMMTTLMTVTRRMMLEEQEELRKGQDEKSSWTPTVCQELVIISQEVLQRTEAPPPEFYDRGHRHRRGEQLTQTVGICWSLNEHLASPGPALKPWALTTSA
ncbi:hypothetical protein H920_01944 [Fukomys damarensis]|uniref:Uncharacterized protein n=1 Tax=Fukomys damarensis TaxID=885580 RepID=A0A091E232_FUKDA|nr:hypothetical protein H920_01944 [Fukomys damarensis]